MQHRQSLIKPKNPQPGQLQVDQLHAQALTLHQQGKLIEAKAMYESILKVNPRHFDALHLIGVVFHQLNEHQIAADFIAKAIEVNPKNTAAYINRGSALKELKQFDAAIASYDKAISNKPDYAQAYYNRGLVLLEIKRFSEALASYDKALSFKPDYAEAHNNRGNVLMCLKRLEEALASYDKALRYKPDYAEAHYNRGNVLDELKQFEESLDSYDKALTFRPNYAEAYNNRGNAMRDLKRLDEALASCNRALSLRPNYAEAHNSKGNVLRDLKRLDEALECYDRALSLRPDYAEAHNNRGIVLLDLRRPEEAHACYDNALSLRPDYAEAHNNRGNVLRHLKRLDEALASYDRALSLKPDFTDGYYNRGAVLLDLKRLDEALACYDKVIAIKPNFADAYTNRGNVLTELKIFDAAILNFEKALVLQPESEFLFGMYLHTKMKICDWSDLSDSLRCLEASITEKNKVSTPFVTLALIDKPHIHQLGANIYTKAQHPKRSDLGGIRKITKRISNKKIRIGYYSADFHNHATSYLMAELFEAHDATNFELYGFSFGFSPKDEMKERVSFAFDKFFDVLFVSDKDVAVLSRQLEIDIAVDLKGYTGGSRTDIFAEGCAPIQVSYLGYPGTMGADYIDYIIADKTVIPESSQADFTEKVVYLPHSYQVNDSKRKISDRVFTKVELNLPQNGFIFCCFNNNYKILPATFAGWMRILKSVEGSVLWLYEENITATINLRKEAEARGIAGSRLVFAKYMKLDEHLARHRLADLFIDTFPYNAHTTTSDALWAGLPVLTCMGKSFASRVAGSLLTAIELPELITHTQVDYEAKAIELATNPAMLQELKSKLEKNRLTTPLFNSKLFAKHIEASYEAMYERSQAGLPPENIVIQP